MTPICPWRSNKNFQWGCNICLGPNCFELDQYGEDYLRENSPIIQTTPEPTLLSWGGWPRDKTFPPPRPHSQTQSYRAYQATQIPLFSNPLMLPFDTQVCHEHLICLRFHWILYFIQWIITSYYQDGFKSYKIIVFIKIACSPDSIDVAKYNYVMMISCKTNATRTTRTPAFWGYPPPPHDYPHYWVIMDPKSKK